MAFCSKCGAQLDPAAVFCNSCGTPAGGPAGPGGPAFSPGGAAPPNVGGTAMSSNVAGLLTYILGFITGIIFLVIEPYKRDPFVRFHAFQSIFLSVAYIIVAIAWGIVSGAIFIGSLGIMWHLVFLSWVLVRIAFFLIWLFMLYKAYNNERYMLPVIGPLAAKQAGA